MVLPVFDRHRQKFPRRVLPDVFSKLIPGIYWALLASDFIAGSVIRNSVVKGEQGGPEVVS